MWNRRCFSVKKEFESTTLDINQEFWKCVGIFKGIVTDFRIKLFHKICKPILLVSHKVENRWNRLFFISWGSFPLFLLRAQSFHGLQCTSHSSAIFFTAPFFRYLLVTISMGMVLFLSVGIDISSWMLYNLESNDKIHSEGTCMEKYEVALLNLTEN